MTNKGRSGGLHTGCGKAACVDKSLFGNTKLPSINRSASAEKSSPKMKCTILSPDSVTITQRDLERMLRPSPILTADQVATQKAAASAKKEAAQAVSKARKEKMMRLEEEAKKRSPVSESDKICMSTDLGTRSRAEKLLEEQKDQVKAMNQMMLYSKCVTIRDAQIEEKRALLHENEEEKHKQDMMMEVERIRAIEQYEAREATRNDERRRGARVLEEQIHEREKERIRQEELRDQERIAMLREIERQKEEELQEQIEKKIRGKQMMEEVATANAEQIHRKEMMKLREKDEDQKVQEYVMAKMLREQKAQAEKERIAHEKDIETARMRALQEKSNDKQAELDELLARRHQEAKEREWRAKEKAGQERQVAMQSELMEAREAQKHAALTQRASMAKVEYDQFVRVLAVNRTKEQEDMISSIQKVEVNNHYKQDLQAQIGMEEEKKKKKRQVCGMSGFM
eukprot:gene24210-9809_t